MQNLKSIRRAEGDNFFKQNFEQKKTDSTVHFADHFCQCCTLWTLHIALSNEVCTCIEAAPKTWKLARKVRFIRLPSGSKNKMHPSPVIETCFFFWYAHPTIVASVFTLPTVKTTSEVGLVYCMRKPAPLKRKSLPKPRSTCTSKVLLNQLFFSLCALFLIKCEEPDCQKS